MHRGLDGIVYRSSCYRPAQIREPTEETVTKVNPALRWQAGGMGEPDGIQKPGRSDHRFPSRIESRESRHQDQDTKINRRRKDQDTKPDNIARDFGPGEFDLVVLAWLMYDSADNRTYG
jgi:hypothetical protein